MYTRLDEVPVLEYRDAQIGAHRYNRVQIALKRLGEPLRWQIPKLKHLDLIIEREAWIVVDRVLNDVPVVAWTDFQAEHRENLHEPVKCRVRYYHAHAGMILERTLKSMETLLGDELNKLAPTDHTPVLPFRHGHSS
jgi:hypothetical protein